MGFFISGFFSIHFNINGLTNILRYTGSTLFRGLLFRVSLYFNRLDTLMNICSTAAAVFLDQETSWLLSRLVPKFPDFSDKC